MSDDRSQPATYGEMTVDHEEIRQWVDERGGEPVLLDGTENRAVGIRFDAADSVAADREATATDWRSFFERFDTQDLVFAYEEEPTSDGPADRCALFDRVRVEQSERVGDVTEDSPTEVDQSSPTNEDVQQSPETSPNQPGDGRSTVRHEEATDQENADNHRDEGPFQS